jgi:hypothetical protein
MQFTYPYTIQVRTEFNMYLTKLRLKAGGRYFHLVYIVAILFSSLSCILFKNTTMLMLPLHAFCKSYLPVEACFYKVQLAI